MPNEFEKLVQQKMDELKLVPSEPVWQKVEMQIRKKKDRRRMFFWISFLALLLGGGLWIGASQYSYKVSYNKNNDVIEKELKKTSDNNLPVTTTIKPIPSQSPGHITTITPGNKMQNKKNEEKPKTKSSGVVLNIEPSVQNDVSEKASRLTPKISKNKNQAPLKPEEAELNKTTNGKVVVAKSSIEKMLKEAILSVDIQVKADTTNAMLFNERKIGPGASIIDSVKQDTASSKNEIQKQDTSAIKKTDFKKYATSKWKLNLIATEGSSNMNDLSLFKGLFGGEKSLAAPNYNSGAATSGGPLYYGPSDIQKGFSFAVGAVAKKQLAKRMFFSTGLQYKYYSNTIQVGNKINQNRVLMDFAVSQYYSNTGTSLQPYHNRYYFVALPVAMDWQLLKKIPLNFYTGFSMQYLIKTNGLVFDHSTQSYFYSKDAFNRVQLFFEPALTYSVSFKQKVLTFGPQLQYALTRLEKNNPTYHLASYGLKAQIQIGKK